MNISSFSLMMTTELLLKGHAHARAHLGWKQCYERSQRLEFTSARQTHCVDTFSCYQYQSEWGFSSGIHGMKYCGPRHGQARARVSVYLHLGTASTLFLLWLTCLYQFPKTILIHTLQHFFWMSEKDCPVGLKEWLEYIKQKFNILKCVP